MAFDYTINSGYLEIGIHSLTIDQFIAEFATNSIRKKLMEGFLQGVEDLKKCGCKIIYVGGSFVTAKSTPSDVDACWDHNGVNLPMLKTNYPVFFDFDNLRANQKAAYGSEFFLAEAVEGDSKQKFRDFFQKNKNGVQVGIIRIDL
jgi:hypothetical protein